jgi:ActR/RegA family two-component response regulator
MPGEELLIADGADRDRDGLRKLFDDQGYVCTATGDLREAQEFVRRKFFPAAVIDLDFGGTGGGIEFVRFLQQTSRPTRIVILAGRRSFEAAVEALRLGVLDVVSKRPDQIAALQQAVRRAIDLSATGSGGAGLVGEVKVVLDEALSVMLGMARRLHGAPDTSGAGMGIKPAVLIIDEDQVFLDQMVAALSEKGWDISTELSGGSGLDRASTYSFQIVAVRDPLSDLPSQMLLRSAQGQQPQVLGLLYSTGEGGRTERYDAGRPGRSWPCGGAADLVRNMEELAAELATRREERRYLQAFRNEHGAFLKRVAELKVRIDALAE